MICPNCGAENDSQANECILCGYIFETPEQESTETQTPVIQETPSAEAISEKSNSSKAPIIAISIVCAILVLAVIALTYFLINKNDDNGIVVSSSAAEESSIDKPTVKTTTTATTTTTTTAATTTTTTKATTTTTKKTTPKTTTTKAEPVVYAKNLTSITKGGLMNKYFNNLYDVDYISIGQQSVAALTNTGRLPYFKFGFMYMDASQIPDGERVCTVHVLPGGKIDKNTEIGMTYNELKKIYNFEGASFDGGTFGATAWVYIDGVKWGIEFDLTPEDKVKLGVSNGIPFEMIGVPFDLSDINPKSILGYYIESVQ